MIEQRFVVTDRVWEKREPLLPGKPTDSGVTANDNRLFLEAVLWRVRTGSPWRDLPEDFGKWSSVYRQFRRWTLAGLWEDILEALNESGVVPDALQMIDSTVIRAHHQAAGAKGGLRARVLAVQEVASRPRSTSASTHTAYP